MQIWCKILGAMVSVTHWKLYHFTKFGTRTYLEYVFGAYSASYDYQIVNNFDLYILMQIWCKIPGIMVSVTHWKLDHFTKFGAQTYLEGIFYMLFGGYSAWYDYQIAPPRSPWYLLVLLGVHKRLNSTKLMSPKIVNNLVYAKNHCCTWKSNIDLLYYHILSLSIGIPLCQ